MTEHYLAMSITQEQVDNLIATIKTIDASLPSLIELTSDQRKSMAHYSDKELGFIQKTLQIAEQHPEIFPANFNFRHPDLCSGIFSISANKVSLN